MTTQQPRPPQQAPTPIGESLHGSRPPRLLDEIDAAAAAMLAQLGHGPIGGEESVEQRLASEMIRTAVKLLRDGADVGQLKLVSAAMKEMRHAYRVFGRYRGTRKIAIFGSARTPPDHPDYTAARDFGRLIADSKWMAITGAGAGIMKAGHEGPQRDASFGLSIRLPFETIANEVIEGDPKLITFRYFFTRKLMFLSHSDAVAVFPGGFGTHDELFEALTLIQTGKSSIVPIVLVEGQDRHGMRRYWPDWNAFVETRLLAHGWISPEDSRLYHIAASVEDAVEHVLRFYRRFHSYRYVRQTIVIRMKEALSANELAALNAEFGELVASGEMVQGPALPEETDHRELPRLMFHHTRRQYGLVRALIDAVNGG